MTSILQAIYDKRNTTDCQLRVGMSLGNQILDIENSRDEVLKIARIFRDDDELQEECAQRLDKLWNDKYDLSSKLYDLGWALLGSDDGTIGIVRNNLDVTLSVELEDDDFEF